MGLSPSTYTAVWTRGRLAVKESAMIDVLRRFHNSLQFVVIPARSFKAYLDSTQTPDFEYFSRLSWETSTPQNNP